MPLAAIVGLVIVLVIGLGSLFARQVSPYDPSLQDLRSRLLPPLSTTQDGRFFLLGTDHLGRDVFSRVVYGGRVSLTVALASVTAGGVIGVVIGLLVGYKRGVLDLIIMRLVDVQLSLPFILLALSVMSVLGPGLVNIVVVLALTSWLTYARLVRSQTLSVRESEYVEAARALGCKDLRLVLRHVLPNVIGPAIVLATLETGRMIVVESGLSFLGLGVPADTPSWGMMLSDGRLYLSTAWWVATAPGLAISITILAISFLGDWVKQRLDPLSEPIDYR